jgi:ABC-type multidrug transport system ATPase subunit
MIITTSNLGKRFNREWIFKGLTAEFSAGNTYAIVGPNGSGKSTLMRVLWGQEPPSEGEINYSSNNQIIELESVFHHISIVTPYMELIDELTLKEHIEFHFKFKHPDQNLTTTEIIKRLDLESASNKPIRQFSSGMKQRLKLGLAFSSENNILFLDEPTTNLDEKAISWYFGNLLEIQTKKLVFIATNQPSDYPKGTQELDLSNLKTVTKQTATGIQSS